MQFVYGEEVSLYGQLRKVVYGPINEDRNQTSEEAAEEHRLNKQILDLHGEHGEIEKQFAIGQVPNEQRHLKLARLREIEKKLGFITYGPIV